MTTGTTGYDLYKLCPSLPSMGRFKYAQNQYHAFTQIHADEEELVVRMRGVDPVSNEIVELY